MANNTLDVEFHITYEDVRQTKFATEKSILDASKTVYRAENIKIKEYLDKNILTVLDITTFGYFSGMFKPFGSTVMPSLMTNYYSIKLRIVRKEIVTRIIDQNNLELSSNFKSELLSFFIQTYRLPSGQAVLSKIYRALALKYHPDKGGNEEIMKYINELKGRYIK